MKTKYPLLRWAPRVLGIGLSVFVGLFALDAFRSDATFAAQIGDFLGHLVPAIALLLVVILGWRRPLIAGAILLSLALGYALWAHEHPSWVIAIGGPIMLVGVLFILSKFVVREMKEA